MLIYYKINFFLSPQPFQHDFMRKGFQREIKIKEIVMYAKLGLEQNESN